MRIHKLESTEAFIAIDLADAPKAAGFVRSANKILQGGAKELARSGTYMFASFGLQVAGASGGINAPEDQRSDAIRAFAAEIMPEVVEGRLALDPAKGVDPDLFADLVAADARNAAAKSADANATLLAAGAVAAARSAAGNLGGAAAAIEGFGPHGPALARALSAAGANVTTIGTTAGTAVSATGFDPEELASGWEHHGADMAGKLAEGEPGPAWGALAADVDVVFVGSKTGAISHTNADKVGGRVVVPHAPLPYTTKALVMMERAGKTVIPDFLSTAGPALAGWSSDLADLDALGEHVESLISSATTEATGHADGLFLGACARAEDFLATWQETLPFGRPLAP